MKTLKFTFIGLITLCMLIIFGTTLLVESKPHSKNCCEKIDQSCVFSSLMGEEPVDNFHTYNVPEQVSLSVNGGLSWLTTAQHPTGGWGAGSHYNQKEMDPHAVNPDPATTSMVCMALLRSGSTFTMGTYASQLNKALHWLIDEVETAKEESLTITEEKNTQIQTKLGANIDVVLTAQFFTDALEYLDHDKNLKSRVEACLTICVRKIERAQEGDGSFKGGSWAGVLQSSLANNALEAAQTKGIAVDSVVLDKSRDYQKKNYDTKTGNVNTTKGAGVVLYSVSGSVRASAKEAREITEKFRKAKKDGKIDADAELNEETIVEMGYSEDQAVKYETAYKVYNSAKVTAQDEKVMSGFGNNGGEEFVSFLQTGESMIINKDEEWTKWFDNVSGKLVKIQNENGSWNGHHCITSPVFCTATCVLILSINNDVDKLIELGKSNG